MDLFKLLLLSMLLSFACQAEAMKKTSQGQALDIDADSAIYDSEGQKVTFKGNVLVDNGTFKINSDLMYVHFSADNEIETITALQNVHIRDKGVESFSDKAEYFAVEGKVVLTGDPELHRGGDILNSDKITFFRNSERVETGKVNIVLQAAPKKGKENSKSKAVPVGIDADSAIYYGSKNIVKFSKNVKVNHDDMRLTSEVLYIHLIDAPSKSKESQKSDDETVAKVTKTSKQVDKLIAEVDVVIKTPERTAFAERATYFVINEKIVLSGRPKLETGKEVLRSDRITYYRNSSIVETGRMRYTTTKGENPLLPSKSKSGEKGKK